MAKFFAKLFSFLFHPLLLPAAGIIVLFNSGSILEYLPFEAKKIIFIIVFISTAILPLTFLPFFIFQNIIKSIYMENHKERLIPFFITSVFYFFAYYLLVRIGAPITINVFILASGIAVFILFLLSIKWKISAHMLGSGGLTGALIAISFRLDINLIYFIITAIFISGLLGYSRLKLLKHHPFEVYFGWLVGLLVTLLVISVY